MTKQHDSYRAMGEIFFALCKAVDSPVSLGAWLRFQNNHLALAELSVEPRDYLRVDAFELDYLVVSFLSKWKGLETGLDLKAEAIKKFTASENSCYESNVRLRSFAKNEYACSNEHNLFLNSVFHVAQRKIARVLGDLTLRVQQSLGYRWGPGATSDLRRREAFLDTKLCKLPISVTRRALPYFREIMSADLHWSACVLGVCVEDLVGPFCFLDSVFLITEDCIIDTVPKNAKTDRVIAKEPRGNGFLQQGIGRYLRSRLKRVGINLDDQRPNQDGALRALTDGLATLDLKAASDSMPIELVYQLLPVDWAMFLDDCRSHKAAMPDGTTITLQKFSSMGNGFTFELETLIFWALTRSVTEVLQKPEAEVLVYGDDIICPKWASSEVIFSLAFAGFTVNEEKSFTSGLFYESCGKHYFGGIDVTPVYQKETLEQPYAIMRCGNRLLRVANRLGSVRFLRKEIEPAWRAVRRWSRFEKSEIFFLPQGTEGDDGWLLPASEFPITTQHRDFGLKCAIVRSRSVSLPADEAALLAYTLRRGVVTDTPYGGNLTSSPDTTRYTSFTRGSRWVMPTGEFALDW